MAFDFEGARKAGYSDAEIASYLASQSNFDLSGAKSAGYSDGEVIAELAKKAKAPGASAAEKLAEINGPGNYTAPAPEASIVDKNIGGLEAALTTITGLTGGTLGTAGGTALGILKSIADGTYGTRQGADNVERQAAEAAQALTYQPRTPEGQRQAAAVGEVMQSALPAAAVLHTLPVAATLQPIARTSAAATLDKASTAVPAGLERVKAMVTPAEAGPTPGTMGNVGAAGVDMATQRRVAASQFSEAPLTKGQAGRDPAQLKFEDEAAKRPDELGALVRDRRLQQNADANAFIDRFIDSTGAERSSLREAGQFVDDVARKAFERESTAVKVAYAEAKKSEEGSRIVDPGEIVSVGEGQDAISSSPIQFLNDTPAGLNSTKLIDDARAYAVKLGIAENVDGQLVPKPTPVKVMEQWRSEINAATGYEKPDIRAATILKRMIDAQTEPVAGPLYRNARRMNERLHQNYSDHAVIAKLLGEKRGTTDRMVAVEDIFDHTILKGSTDDVRQVRRVLQRIGPDGHQAWSELQGQTAQWIAKRARESATKDSWDQLPIRPDGLHKAIMELDADKRLDVIFGTAKAQKLRDLDEFVQITKTLPPETAPNRANTAATLLANAFDTGASFGTLGVPLPVWHTSKALLRYVKDAQLRKRILQALGEAEEKTKRKPVNPPPPSYPAPPAPPQKTVH